MARCLICKAVWSEQDSYDPFFVCEYCLATQPVRVSEEWDKLYKKAISIWHDTAYRDELSVDHQFVTSTGAIAWAWVILRANSEHMTPMHVPIEYEQKKRICRLTSISGPYPYSHARLVQALANRDSVSHHGMFEIYDETGFLVTPGNVGRHILTVEEATELIHWGKIQYVYKWLRMRGKPREWHFPKDKSLITSFLGETAGDVLIHNLLMNNVIVWNDHYQVYTTYHFDPKKPPMLRYRPHTEEV